MLMGKEFWKFCFRFAVCAVVILAILLLIAPKAC